MLSGSKPDQISDLDLLIIFFFSQEKWWNHGDTLLRNEKQQLFQIHLRSELA